MESEEDPISLEDFKKRIVQLEPTSEEWQIVFPLVLPKSMRRSNATPPQQPPPAGPEAGTAPE